MLNKINAIRDYLMATVFEMEDEIEAILALLASKQHGFFLGVPGVGKSYLFNQMVKCLDVNSFHRLITATTTPSELFGPFSLKALKNDELKNATEGYLPTAHVAFFDEMFKGNSQTLNSNLTAMNERLFMNGAQVEDIPLMSLFAASNELPADESLNALWDRFTVRMVVESLKLDDSVRKLLINSHVPVPVQLTVADLELIQSETKKVDVSPIIEDIIKLRAQIAGELSGELLVSDRRWKQIVGYMQGLAYINGDTKLTKDYLSKIGNTLWKEPKQLAAINTILSNYMSTSVSRTQELYNQGIALVQIGKTAKGDELAEVYSELKERMKELEEKLSNNPDQATFIKPVVDRFEAEFKVVKARYMKSISLDF